MVTSTVYSMVNHTAGQNSWLPAIETKFLGKFHLPAPVSNGQLLRDMRTTSSSGVTNSTTTRTMVGMV